MASRGPVDRVLWSVRLSGEHEPTGFCRHLTHGEEWKGGMFKPFELQITGSKPGDGFLLLYLDDDGGGLADTWHESIADAQKQAELEFGIEADDWVAADNP